MVCSFGRVHTNQSMPGVTCSVIHTLQLEVFGKFRYILYSLNTLPNTQGMVRYDPFLYVRYWSVKKYPGYITVYPTEHTLGYGDTGYLRIPRAFVLDLAKPHGTSKGGNLTTKKRTITASAGHRTIREIIHTGVVDAGTTKQSSL